MLTLWSEFVLLPFHSLCPETGVPGPAFPPDGLKPQGINLVPFSATNVAITKSEKEEDEFVEIQTVLQNIYVHSSVQNCNYKVIPLEFFSKTNANLRLIVKLVVFDSFKLIFPNFSQRLSRVFWQFNFLSGNLSKTFLTINISEGGKNKLLISSLKQRRYK